MSQNSTLVKQENLTDMKVGDFIKQLESEVSRLAEEYHQKEMELDTLMVEQETVRSRYMQVSRTKSSKETGKAYLFTVNELMRIESEETQVMKDMRALAIEKEKVKELLTAYEEYENIKK